MARRFGYSRVSTSDQDWPLQLEALTKAGVDDRDIFRERASGAKRDRTELRRMLVLLRPGDQATVYRLDRLARSQLHLLQIIEEIEGKGAKLVSLMDNIDTGTATRKMVVGVLAVLAEFERNLLMERCTAGMKIARQRNVRFGRPPKLTPSLIRQVLLAHDDASTTVPETCRVLGRVDGFDDDEAKSECDEGCKVLVRFLATERNALEALELADEVFDTGAGSIECLREERWPVLGR